MGSARRWCTTTPAPAPSTARSSGRTTRSTTGCRPGGPVVRSRLPDVGGGPLVGRLAGVRVEGGRRQPVRGLVVHRQEDLAGADVGGDVGPGPNLAADRHDDHLVVGGDAA